MIADGVHLGYAEAQVSAGVWKGRPRRAWRQTRIRPRGLTGKSLDRWVTAMARKFPANVKG